MKKTLSSFLLTTLLGTACYGVEVSIPSPESSASTTPKTGWQTLPDPNKDNALTNYLYLPVGYSGNPFSGVTASSSYQFFNLPDTYEWNFSALPDGFSFTRKNDSTIYTNQTQNLDKVTFPLSNVSLSVGLETLPLPSNPLNGTEYYTFNDKGNMSVYYQTDRKNPLILSLTATNTSLSKSNVPDELPMTFTTGFSPSISVIVYANPVTFQVNGKGSTSPGIPNFYFNGTTTYRHNFALASVTLPTSIKTAPGVLFEIDGTANGNSNQDENLSQIVTSASIPNVSTKKGSNFLTSRLSYSLQSQFPNESFEDFEVYFTQNNCVLAYGLMNPNTSLKLSLPDQNNAYFATDPLFSWSNATLQEWTLNVLPKANAKPTAQVIGGGTPVVYKLTGSNIPSHVTLSMFQIANVFSGNEDQTNAYTYPLPALTKTNFFYNIAGQSSKTVSLNSPQIVSGSDLSTSGINISALVNTTTAPKLPVGASWFSYLLRAEDSTGKLVMDVPFQITFN